MIEKDLNCLDFFQERFELSYIKLDFGYKKFFLDLTLLSTSYSVIKNGDKTSLCFGVVNKPGIDYLIYKLKSCDKVAYEITVKLVSNLKSTIEYKAFVDSFDFALYDEYTMLSFIGDVEMKTSFNIEPTSYLIEEDNGK